MAHLFIRHQEQGWVILPLQRAPVALTDQGAQPVFAAEMDHAGNRALLITRHDAGDDRWALVAQPDADVRVNGQSVVLGIRVLADRDAIQVGNGEPMFFSAERVPQVETATTSGAPVACPRCRQDIVPGSPVVRCPGCDVIHHQSSDLPCWTGYERARFATCALCDTPATLAGDLRWTPDAL
jgi:hypothetical protein